MAKTKSEQLADRRAYYARNRDKIRTRDNLAARKKREADPVKYAESQRKYRENRKPREIDGAEIRENPDFQQIISAILTERGQMEEERGN